ncbi:MAG: DUF5752 family protein [Candidatus Bathyarchaeota archaeon]
MSKKVKEKKPTLNKADANKFLRTVPKNEGLGLYKAPGEFTGKTVLNFSALSEALRSVDIRAINYHFKRRDFEKWIRGTIGDEELARRFGRLDRELHGEKLRSSMATLVKTRLDELKAAVA